MCERIVSADFLEWLRSDDATVYLMTPEWWMSLFPAGLWLHEQGEGASAAVECAPPEPMRRSTGWEELRMWEGVYCA